MRILISLFALILLFTTSPAFAGEPVFCGQPEDVNISTEGGDFCDIHSRRIAYRREAIKLKGQMQERAKNFAAPRQAAYEQYLKDLEALDEERSSQAYEDTKAMMEAAAEEELVELNDEPEPAAILDDVDELEDLDPDDILGNNP